jgi:hypothetical protein
VVLALYLLAGYRWCAVTGSAGTSGAAERERLPVRGLSVIPIGNDGIVLGDRGGDLVTWLDWALSAVFAALAYVVFVQRLDRAPRSVTGRRGEKMPAGANCS